jgi:hypothetical protein
MEIGQDNVIKESGEVIMKGEAAISWTGNELYLSKQRISDKIFFMLSGSYLQEHMKKNLILPDLASRIVKDAKVIYAYEKTNNDLFAKANMGQIFKIWSPYSESIERIRAESSLTSISGLLIGSPSSVQKTTIIKNVNIDNASALDYNKTTPWINIKRSCTMKANDLEIVDTIVTLKSFISNEEIKSDAYQAFKNDLEKNFYFAAIVLQKPTNNLFDYIENMFKPKNVTN